MGLLSKLKSVLGLEREKRPASPAEPDVTIEREPDAASERAVKGAGGSARPAAASEPATPSEAESEREAESEAEPESEAETATDAESGADEGEPDSPSVDEIDGIGPTYAERLADAGIETVADLADSDAETVAQAAETGQSRAEDWLEQARDR